MGSVWLESGDPAGRKCLYLKETTGGEFRVYRASIRLLKRDIYRPSTEGNYPPENVLDVWGSSGFRASGPL